MSKGEFLGTNDTLTEKIIGCFLEVHKSLGPGFTEKTYVNALKVVFSNCGFSAEYEKQFNVYFQEKLVGYFKADIVVGDKVIIEVKAIDTKIPLVFERQVVSYLKSSGKKVGLLVNFGCSSCEFRRIIAK